MTYEAELHDLGHGTAFPLCRKAGEAVEDEMGLLKADIRRTALQALCM